MIWLKVIPYLFHYFIVSTVYATVPVKPLNGPCTIETNTASSDIIISGNKSEECSFNISTSSHSIMNVSGSFYGNDYLYIDTYSKIFVAGPKLKTTCIARLPQTFTLVFRGNITLKLKQIQDSSVDGILPDSDVILQCRNQPNCCAFEEYSYTVKCQAEENTKAVACDLKVPHTSNCTCQLNDKDIVSECWSSENQHYTQHRGFLLYPPTASVDKFRFFELRYSNLTGMSRGAFQTIQKHVNIDYVDLSYNQIADIVEGTFVGTNGTAGLHLDHNRLTTLRNGSFQGIEALFFLALSSNRLTSIETGVFQKFSQIKHINLEDNRLTTIGMGVFRGLYTLRTLTLGSNSLRGLHTDLFIDLNNTEILNVSSNRLDTIPHIGHMKMLKRLELWDNELYLIEKKVFKGVPSTLIAFADQHEVCECYLADINETNCHIINEVEQSNYLTCNRLLTNIALASFTWVIGFCALIGNVVVLLWRLFRKEQENRIQSLLLRNLAAADFFMGLYMIIIASADAGFSIHFPMQSEMWRNSPVCKLAGVFATTSSEASVFFITLISVDRFMCIRCPSPSTNFHSKKTWLVVCCTWLVALLLGIVSSVLSGKYPEFYDHSHLCIGLPLSLKSINAPGKYNETDNKTTDGSFKQTELSQFKFDVTSKAAERFEPAMYFSIGVFLVLNSICLIIIIICYLVIIRIVQQSQKRIKGDMSRQIRLTIKVAMIVATDFCSWLPIILIGILVQTRAIPSESIPPTAYAWIVTFVLPINSAINPFLYTLATAISASNRASRHSTDKMEIQALTNKGEQGTKATSNTIL